MHQETPNSRASRAAWVPDDASLAAANSIPVHPLGVKPLGNQYLESGPNARASMGRFCLFPDEMLMTFLEYLDAASLRTLGSVCRFLYAACRYDDIWKSLYLESELAGTNAVKWKGTWRSTLLQLPEELTNALSCSNVFSDVIHRPFVCSNIHLATYAANIPARNQIPKLENMSYDDFADQWSQKPFVLTKCIRDWPAVRDWSLDYFSTRHGDVVFRAESVDWSFETYTRYMASTSDESPLYLFDKMFAEKMGISVGTDANAAYWRPGCFGPDLFELLGAERPAHRWLIIGPERSGSTFHKDPNATSAWNAVIKGAKYWIMFPPGADVPGVFVSSDSSEVTSPLSIAEWLLEFHTEARHLPDCVEGVCGAGEILHVPSGWWHLVVNLEPGIALTQNFVPKSPNLHHLSEAVGFLRDKPDQVTGFKRDVEDPYRLFADRLRQHHPGLLERALEVLETKKEGKKRKWDTAVGGDEGESGTGFSFGFGGDDEEIP